METNSLNRQALNACRRALNLQNQDPTSKTKGCFDRRFWAWKLIDYPEATFQRLVSPLSWYADVCEERLKQQCVQAVRLGLDFACSIQNRDGSFDQAYPGEHSYGATAFLLHDLIQVFKLLTPLISEERSQFYLDHIHRSTLYLHQGDEGHAFIANHLAGSALSLLEAGKLLGEPGFEQHAHQIVHRIIASQSEEGWYPEYGGADPGYQTLCMHYLAQFYVLQPDPMYLRSLERSLQFLSFFVHPDGTFAGEYGSRRTAVYYPGGIALLAAENSLARAIHKRMLRSIGSGNTVGVNDIDVGNLAPLLSSTILAAQVVIPEEDDPLRLPYQETDLVVDLPDAGIALRGNQRYYAILGISNGGVLKVFNKDDQTLIYNDCGLLVETKSGKAFTSQTLKHSTSYQVDGKKIRFKTALQPLKRMQQSPLKFILLRLANITFMRWAWMNELVKKYLVKLLIRAPQKDNFVHEVLLEFLDDSIQVHEVVTGKDLNRVHTISTVSGLLSIHMASAGYPLSTSTKSEIQPLHYDRNEEGLVRDFAIQMTGENS